MDFRARRCIVDTFSTENAFIGVKYGDAVVEYFEARLVEELEKVGLVVETEPSVPQPDHVVVEGRFRKIDAGNRFLRWLFMLTFVFGAVMWVQGTCSVGDEKVSDFDVLATHGGGLYSWVTPFGGKGHALLERCAKKTAKKVAREVAQGLKRWP